MVKSRRVALGVDCGGTNLKLGFISELGELIRSKNDPITFNEPPEKVIKKIAQRMKNFIKESKIKNTEFVGVGVGIAGEVDQKSGVVRFSPNLNWQNVPLKDLLSKEIQFPLLIDNDANCAAWGAYWLDAKRDCDHLICLTLGTGIGGGMILNRRLYRGSTGSAGEIGHASIQFNGRPCRCGSFGCLESMIGAWGLVQTANEGLRKGAAEVLKKILQSSPKRELDPELIALAAARGDLYCQQLWKDAGEALGSALANCVNIFNPERIVLSGGVSKVGSLILEPALHTLGRRAFSTPAQKVKVTISQFTEKLGVAGAGLLLWE